MLRAFHTPGLTEAGVDEAGRGCLAGPVFAAAVILPAGYSDPELNDSKQIPAIRREKIRKRIEQDALAWSVASVAPAVIDEINILNASILAMHRALDALSATPDLILVDGNRFKPWNKTAHHCIVRGDATYMSIAAASILAKTHRDEYMRNLSKEFPVYGWERNVGYPSSSHREAIYIHGSCIHHRMSFRLTGQLKLEL
jgi:ribonuclease HII